MAISKEHKCILFAAFAARFTITKKELKKLHFSSQDIEQIESLSKKFRADFKNTLLPLDKNTTLNQLKNIQSENACFTMILTLQAPLALHKITYKNIGRSDISVADTRLLNAIKNNDFEKTKQLIKEKANTNAVDFDGRSALCIACINNNSKITSLLLENGANPNHLDRQKMTPIHYCASFGYNTLIELLKNHGAKLDTPENEDTPAPLSLALLSNHFDTVDLLVKLGCQLDAVDREGHTPFHSALANFRSASQNDNLQLKNHYALQIKHLLQHNLDINRRCEKDELKDYFLIGFSNQIQYQKLDETDYKLITLFQQKGYFPDKHCINTNGYNVKGYLFETNNERLLEIFDLIPEGFSYRQTKIENGKYVATFVNNDQPDPEDDFENIISRLEQQLFEAFASNLGETETHTSKQIAYEPPNPQKQPVDKNKLIDEILSTVKNCQEFVAKKTQSSFPTWLSSINKDSIGSLPDSKLSALQTQISEWKNKLVRRILNKQKPSPATNPNAFFPNTIKEEPTEIKIDALYENIIHFNPSTMKKIEGSDNACLLVPLNTDGNINLDIIHDSEKMNPEEQTAFERILESPRHSFAKLRQPGVRFFIGNYFCNVNINGSQEQRQIVGELKISNSDSRIALYPLKRSGNGPLVLALGPFVPGGFHKTQKKTIFQAHPLTLNNEIVKAKLPKSCPK